MTLSIALPNKGSLSEESAVIFREAGYRVRSEVKELSFYDSANDAEFYYLRPRDIATYVASGEIDVGVTGRDLLLDTATTAVERLGLDFGHSEFCMAAPVEEVRRNGLSESYLKGKRIATSYPGLVKRFLSEKNLTAEIVELDGAVEGAIRLGVADVVIDVVATGNTIKQAGLQIFGQPILKSEAILISRADFRESAFDLLMRRLSGVVIARQYVLVDYDIERNLLDKACQITPGLESPTVSPLQKPEWVAVRAMVKRGEVHVVMDHLWELGARGILVTDIHSCRL